MIAALDTAQTITLGVVTFFALIALITIVRVILRREASAWRRLRVGFFIERERDEPGEK